MANKPMQRFELDADFDPPQLRVHGNGAVDVPPCNWTAQRFIAEAFRPWLNQSPWRQATWRQLRTENQRRHDIGLACAHRAVRVT